MSIPGIISTPRSDKSRRKLRIVIGHPYIGRGGSEAVVMWLIEALKGGHEVTVLSTGGWDLPELNGYYGTEINENEVRVRIARVPWPARNLSVAALRGACFQRFAREVAAEYDLRISAYNPTDWGLPAIHLIADFSWLPEIRHRFDPPTPGAAYRDSIVRKAYLRFAATYSSPSGRDILRDDLLIANSKWSAEIIEQTSGIQCAAVVYPPVWTDFSPVPWEEKEEAFVMIGRIVPEKRIEEAIVILEAVRARGHAIRLHLCGEIGDDPYGRRIAQLCRERADWVVLEGRVSGTRKYQILTHCRYGIQTRRAEPFGISVAEMVKAGAIVFTSDIGGPVEILDRPDLLFADAPEAVDKIHNVLAQPYLQQMLREHLIQRAHRFTTKIFIEDLQKILGYESRQLPLQEPANYA